MSWNATMHLSPSELVVLVTTVEEDDLLRARLPPISQHPRALQTILEGLALFSGARLSAVISVEPSAPLSLEEAHFGGALWPTDSALVRFELAPMVKPRPRRLRGLGDFRSMYPIARRRTRR
jgi:hypothetical protein